MIEPLDSLGGDLWGRVQVEPVGEVLPQSDVGLTIHDVALASYLAAAGRALVATTAEHARGRVQFGKPISRFQAVAHPLADCAMRLSAAATLARAGGFHFDREAWIEARRYGAAARLSAASAAREAAAVCHQVFGAIGITVEGPAYRYSRRIEQLAASPVGASRARYVNAPVLSAWRDPDPEAAGDEDAP
jgi:alkylation response protein AidB-like acyl-CoA dehydrogenase